MIDMSYLHFFYQFMQSFCFGCSFYQSHRAIYHEISYSTLCSMFIKGITYLCINTKAEIIAKTIIDCGCYRTFVGSNRFILTLLINFLKLSILYRNKIYLKYLGPYVPDIKLLLFCHYPFLY